jgi:hypothetical protein
MIFQQLKQQLSSLSNLISLLDDEQYSKKIAHLGNASIGGHTRHIIELLVCATEGFSNGTVDYLNRKRNLVLEQNRRYAQETIQEIELSFSKPDKVLKLLVDECEGVESTPVSTTYFREIVYNTEHTIHHLALIKVALIEMNLNLVDDNFGMAYSTIKFKASLVESN